MSDARVSAKSLDLGSSLAFADGSVGAARALSSSAVMAPYRVLEGSENVSQATTSVAGV